MKKHLFFFLFCGIITISHAQYWGKTPIIGSDGVMEIGKYIDFHETSSDTKDFSVRLYSDAGILRLNHSFTIGGLMNANTLLLNDPNSVDNWNNLWQSGFFEGYNRSNAPEPYQWFWGINMGHSSNSSTYKYNGQIAIRNSCNTPTMYFRSTNQNGEGIWTKVLHSTGDQSMSGNFTVAGNIHAREIKVTTNAGADFVFEEGYSLRTLEETEKFIQDNKHLPDIPSAKEMVEQGISVGEMNVKLLQKIEELTLYVIGLKKENETIKLKNNEQDELIRKTLNNDH